MASSTVALVMSRRRLRHFQVVEPARSGDRLLGIVAKYDMPCGFSNDRNALSVEMAAFAYYVVSVGSEITALSLILRGLRDICLTRTLTL